MELYIKRDDLSGMELSGNKVRKLEFLLADALSKGADTLITIGGIQSNHCRATAVAARLAGLEAHLILRTSRALAGSDPGLEGNLLVERMVGAKVHLVTKEEYAKHGSEHLGKVLAERLAAEGRRPYVIPVGGSNALGTWGYMEAVREIEQQLGRDEAGGASAFDDIAMACGRGEGGGASGFDDIAMACGSGGTSAGLALGVHLSALSSTRVLAYSVGGTSAGLALGVHLSALSSTRVHAYSVGGTSAGLALGVHLSALSSTRVHAYSVGGTSAGLALGVHLSALSSTRVHAYSVCDSPGYFYDYIQGLLDGVTSTPGSVASKDLLRVIDVKGAGYAISTEEELQLVQSSLCPCVLSYVKGAGYAMSTEEELQLVQSVAQSTGIVLDPVYSGKALRGLLQDMKQNPDEWAGRRVLFVHTGGLLGMYDKVQQLLPMVGGWERMAV
ncbi:unnamed protein product [Closterium sp. NIES-64]|nr:unnamed protein product [Closterium sp. NIES-64]